MLRKIRVIIAAIVAILFAILFLDFSGVDRFGLSALAKIQLLPAMLSGSVAVVFTIILVTLIFGRVYCSVVCPLGILQDIIAVKDRIFRKIFKLKRKRLKYREPSKVLRLVIFLFTFLTPLLGFNALVTTLDPYSNFGRIATNLFKPIVLAINNVVATIANNGGNYDYYRVTIEVTSWGTFIFAAVVLLVLTLLVVRDRRIWCNTICPVGTFLGIISKYSLLKMTINENCVHCKKCVAVCKSECINDAEYEIDNSRCVTCFNCISKCNKGAISYTFRANKVNKENLKSVKMSSKDSSVKPTSSQNNIVASLQGGETSRRAFLASLVASAALPLAVTAQGRGRGGGQQGRGGGNGVKFSPARYPLPPGAGSIERFQSKCTACQLCVSKCPSHLLRPALLENGINGLMQPYMGFGVHKFCEYECKVCIDVCPNDALQKITLEEKKLTQVGVVNFDIRHCVVEAKGQFCGACAEHCPTQAVAMKEYKNGLTIPTITPDICIGCGACESICPVQPRAIYIVRNDVQKVVEPPTIQDTQNVEIDDFGF